MKKRFLPFSLLLVIMILGQSVIADQGGHYVPRTQPTMNSESFMGSLRVNQKTGLIDPVDMFKAMQAPVMSDRAEDALYWINMGPDNMGGQTTAILYDNTLNASFTNLVRNTAVFHLVFKFSKLFFFFYFSLGVRTLNQRRQ